MSTLVIGVGNPDRGDDGVGWRVVELVSLRLPTLRSSGEPASLIEAWSGRAEVVVVDATSTGAAVGTIAVGLPSCSERSSNSSHGLGILQAIQLGRALDAMPEELLVIGIEGVCFDHGSPLSAAVEMAATTVAEAILTGTAPNLRFGVQNSA